MPDPDRVNQTQRQTLRLPEPMTFDEIRPHLEQAATYYGYKGERLDLTVGAGFVALARTIEAETLRRVKEANE